MLKISQTLTSNQLIGDALRFVLAGGINTLLTLFVYQVILFFLPHSFAYALSWLVGILYISIVYPTKVFPGGSASLIKIGATVTIYIVVFMISLWCLEFVVSKGLHERLAIFVVLILSTTLNFVLMRTVYRR